MAFYKKNINQIFEELKTKEEGLDEYESKNRINIYGLNKLEDKKKISPIKIFLNQFNNALVYILITATLISGFIGEFIDAIVIFIIVILNAIFGFVQEYKAEKAIESLKNMINPQTKILRNGKKVLINSHDLTIGDVMIVEEGDKISADGRIFFIANLEIAEASLTGESIPVKKTIETIDNDCILGDQKNMVFSGTIVTKGWGKVIVTSIGMQTEIGKIASLIQAVPEKITNLQKKLEKLSKTLGFIILIICFIVFCVYYLGNSNMGFSQSFLTAIALAVAAIPEGLPAVVTISLGLGVNRMVKKNALVRKLSSVETLGAVDIICTDKTGTLTKNQMTVKKIYANHILIDVDGTGYDTKGGFFIGNKNIRQNIELHKIKKLLEIGVLCNHSELDKDKIIGDPTEGCLLVSGLKGGIDKNTLSQENIWQDEIPFDSTRKMMSVITKAGNKYQVNTKGATENILKQCKYILIDGSIRLITQDDIHQIEQKNKELAQKAMRILGFAYKEIDVLSKNYNLNNIETDLIFVGLQAMIDPPREEVKDSIIKCKKAGIRVIMITGDNLITAQAIANELGIQGDGIIGLDIDSKTNEQLSKLIETTSIFARVNPEHKQIIIKILKEKGHIVSMTGDGVNDAPALKQADIGVAMGITGTDVAKEASDMILLDDNFATIVNAVEEGRGIYDNIKKFVNFLLSTNFGEILIIFSMSILGMPLPLIAIQILRINLVTDGLPALALGVDPIDKNIMNKKPRNTKEGIITTKMIRNIIIISILMTLGAIFIFVRNYKLDLEMARTGVFILLVFMELARVQMIRSSYGQSIFSNKRLIGALLASIGLLFLVIYSPLSNIFQTKIPTNQLWIEIIVTTIIVSFVGILVKSIVDKLSQTKKTNVILTQN